MPSKSESLQWCQAPLSMGFSRQEYWSGLPFPSPAGLPHPGIQPGSSMLRADSLLSEPPGTPPALPGFQIEPVMFQTRSLISPLRSPAPCPPSKAALGGQARVPPCLVHRGLCAPGGARLASRRDSSPRARAAPLRTKYQPVRPAKTPGSPAEGLLGPGLPSSCGPG